MRKTALYILLSVIFWCFYMEHPYNLLLHCDGFWIAIVSAILVGWLGTRCCAFKSTFLKATGVALVTIPIVSLIAVCCISSCRDYAIRLIGMAEYLDAFNHSQPSYWKIFFGNMLQLASYYLFGFNKSDKDLERSTAN